MAKVNYTNMTDAELSVLAAKEDKDALFETANRYLSVGDKLQARKFFIFSSQLGHKKAAIQLGQMCEEDGNTNKAHEYYRLAYSRGDITIACKLAEIIMRYSESDALDILISSAVLGNEDAIKMLHEHYKESGNMKEADYWKVKIR